MKHSWLLIALTFSFFSSIGLRAQAFTKASGPHGGLITAVSVNATGEVLAGTNSAGLFQSSDNGQTWTRLTSGLSDTSITAVSVDNSGKIFVGTASSGVLTSTNNGESFSTIANVTSSSITTIEILVDTVYVGTRNGVFKSVDKGGTFTQLSGISSSAVTSMSVGADGKLLVGNEDGKLYEFSATLNSFTEMNLLGISVENLAVTAVKIAANGDTYAAIRNNGLYKLEQGSFLWQPVSLDFTVGTVRSIGIVNNKIYLGLDAHGIYRSDNNGMSFTASNKGLTDLNITALAVSANNQIFAGTKTDGIFRSSSDGTTFTRVGLPILHITKLTTIPNFTTAFATTATSGIFVSKNSGQTWTDLNLTLIDSSVTALTATSQGFAVVATRSNGIFILREDGTLVNRIDTTPNLNNVTSLAVTATGNIYAGTETGLYRMASGTKQFAQITSGVGSSAVHSLTVSATGSIIARTASALFLSVDGNNFIEIPNSGALTGVIDVAASSQADVIAAVTVNGVFRLKDAGNFEQITAGLEGKTITSLAVDGAGNVIVGTATGVYALMASENSFKQVAGTTVLDVTAISVVSTVIATQSNPLKGSTELLIGTRNNSVFRGTYMFNDQTSIIELPATVGSLGLNTPSPATETMTIPFTLKAENHVVLKIYDAMGMEHQTIINGTVAAGAQTATVNVTNLPAGTYFYRLMIGGAASQRSFIVVR
jgi:ligand-binding sensor domain-containing protein